MKNTINLVTVLLIFSFSYLHAQDTIESSVDSTEKIDLKINLTPSSKYRFVNTNTQKITQDFMGNSIELTQNTQSVFTCEVISNDGIETRIEVNYEKVIVNTSMPQGEFTFDSDKADTDSLSKLKESISTPFFIFLNDEGDLIRIEGLKNFTGNTDDNESLSAIKDRFDKESLAKIFNEESLAKMFDEIFNILPDHPISIGDSWQKNSQQNINHQFNLSNVLTFTLESLSEDLAWINIEGNVTSSMGGESSVGEVNMEGSQNGIFEVDRLSGLTSSSETHQEVNGLLKAQGFEVPVKIISDNITKGEKL